MIDDVSLKGTEEPCSTELWPLQQVAAPCLSIQIIVGGRQEVPCAEVEPLNGNLHHSDAAHV